MRLLTVAGVLAFSAMSVGCVGARPAPGAEAVAATEKLAPEMIRLLGAMPDEVESVMLAEVSALKAKGAPATLILDSLLLDASPGKMSTNPLTVRQRVGRTIAMAGVTRIVLGGSKFRFPSDIGVGPFEERWIIEVSGATEPIRAELEAITANANAPTSDHAGRRVYELIVEGPGEAPYRGPERRWCVAIYDEHTILVAPSRAEIALMVAGLEAAVPTHSKWAGPAARLRPHTPLGILRVCDPTSHDRLSPVNPEAPRADVEWIAISLLEDGVSFALEAHTRETTKATKFYEQLLPPEMFNWSHRARSRSGFSAQIGPGRSMDSRMSLTLGLILLYGINIVI